MHVRKFVSLSFLLLMACTHKPSLSVTPTQIATKNNCDTNAVDYVTDIKPVFKNNCYSCHSTDSVKVSGGGLDLEDTSSLKRYLQISYRGDGIYGSKLYHCMLHSLGSLPMPPTYIVDTCSLLKIRHWLSMGAPLN
ncbi:MAG: hypothetical protein JST82_02665 [Bacteroidetes bacterium]|nr:hypothetical protein [Bacteroidota bacterium]